MKQTASRFASSLACLSTRLDVCLESRMDEQNADGFIAVSHIATRKTSRFLRSLYALAINLAFLEVSHPYTRYLSCVYCIYRSGAEGTMWSSLWSKRLNVDMTHVGKSVEIDQSEQNPSAVHASAAGTPVSRVPSKLACRKAHVVPRAHPRTHAQAESIPLASLLRVPPTCCTAHHSLRPSLRSCRFGDAR